MTAVMDPLLNLSCTVISTATRWSHLSQLFAHVPLQAQLEFQIWEDIMKARWYAMIPHVATARAPHDECMSLSLSTPRL